MKFKFIPTFKIMDHIYSIPKGMDRFNYFINELRGGTKDNLILPIGSYNPMAGKDLHNLLKTLIEDEIERKVEFELNQWNESYTDSKIEYSFAINLIDHGGGLWSQRYLAEYENKFTNQALLKRKIVCMNLYRGEDINDELIQRRFWETSHRNHYQLKYGMPKQLSQIINQERFVQSKFDKPIEISAIKDKEEFIKQYGETEEYNPIFYFFYGEEICKKLNYPFNF